ncbi:MAG: bifunctional 5,10-methylenetetrahydrofolate dehydrogenase/5,10-methenyltetrahydrofolate cyclohydrolase [Acidaminococcaceae bacterium]|nr:bifunctional 5,10-methylenetetrahydrofolate dehydrogenase/5,10-methenyltetrahydrofolate cyclohydrolase [Acidaminococcaceae bacterium]
METIIMRGKPVADAYREKLAAKIAAAGKRGIKVTLAIVLVGDDSASHVYTERLSKLTVSLGADVRVVKLPAATTEGEVLRTIGALNADAGVQGILPMMPMPRHINSDAVGAAVAAEKDMDCLNPVNSGAVFLGRSSMAPCTPRACMAILDYYGIDPTGKHAVVLGRSNVVGKPAAVLLLQKNATVTVCHSRTADLTYILRQADIIVAAVGIPGFVTADMVKPGAVVVDVGINAVDGGIVGDVAPEATELAYAYTPVPGGVGVVSNMMVMECLTRNI